jgi:hypothetical protein
MRSAYHFPANDCCRSGGHQQRRASYTNAENRQRIPQDFDDGEIGSRAVRGASDLGRGSSRGRPPSPIEFMAERAAAALTGLR